MDAVNGAAVLDLLRDADGFLALGKIEVAPGPATLELVVNLRAAYMNLSSRSMQLTMTDAQMIDFLLKLDRLRAVLRFFGQSV
jgi:hypothetical protein